MAKKNTLSLYSWNCSIADGGVLQVVASSVREAMMLVQTTYGDHYDDVMDAGAPQTTEIVNALIVSC